MNQSPEESEEETPEEENASAHETDITTEEQINCESDKLRLELIASFKF